MVTKFLNPKSNLTKMSDCQIVEKSRPCYYNFFYHFGGATNQYMLLTETCYCLLSSNPIMNVTFFMKFIFGLKYLKKNQIARKLFNWNLCKSFYKSLTTLYCSALTYTAAKQDCK